MLKKSAINFVLLIFSFLSAVIIFALGEFVLAFLHFVPFIIQTGAYMLVVISLCLLFIFISEKVSTGNYIPRGHITFNKTCAKATAIFIPLALIIGLTSQLLYSRVSPIISESAAGFPGTVIVLEQGEEIPTDIYPYWWGSRPPGAGTMRIGGSGLHEPIDVFWWNIRPTPATMETATLGVVENPHPNLQIFYEGDFENMSTFLNSFVHQILGENATMNDWLGVRSPSIPEWSPSFLEIANGDEALAFAIAVEYTYGAVLENAQNTLSIKDDYEGEYAQEFMGLWGTLSAWVASNNDACTCFHMYWSYHILPQTRALPDIFNIVFTDRPPYPSLQAFFDANSEGLHGFILAFVRRDDVLGPAGTINDWLRTRSPSIPPRAPSFLSIAAFDEGLAFRIAMEYTLGHVLNPARTGVRTDYTGTHGYEYWLLWQNLNAWVAQNQDFCTHYHQFWAYHIMPDARELPLSLNIMFLERPHILMRYTGPGEGSMARILLQASLLALWGIIIGIAIVFFLNNTRLINSFLILRIILCIIFSVAFALMLAFAPLYIYLGAIRINMDMVARVIFTLGLCLLFLPTYSWGEQNFNQNNQWNQNPYQNNQYNPNVYR